ncbi:hypothetical protein D3C72_2420400 [compost metagenome]
MQVMELITIMLSSSCSINLVLSKRLPHTEISEIQVRLVLVGVIIQNIVWGTAIVITEV